MSKIDEIRQKAKENKWEFDPYKTIDKLCDALGYARGVIMACSSKPEEQLAKIDAMLEGK